MIKRLSESTLSLKDCGKFFLALKGLKIVALGRAKRRQPPAPPWVSEDKCVSAEKPGVFHAVVDRGRNIPRLVAASVNRHTKADLTPRPRLRLSSDPGRRRCSHHLALGYDIKPLQGQRLRSK